MPAVGALVRCTDGSWMTRPPQRCPAGHRLEPGRMLVGHQPCSTCAVDVTTWTCPECGAVVYGPSLNAGCRVSRRCSSGALVKVDDDESTIGLGDVT
jgi:hypothetical protein